MRKSLISEKLKEKNEKFIDGSIAEIADQQTVKEDLHEHVQYIKWPILGEIFPSYASGSQLNKALNLPLKEYEWNSVDRHTKALGVKKTEWIRYAMFKLLEEEQLYFFKEKPPKK